MKSAADINFMDPVIQENWFSAYDILHKESTGLLHARNRHVCAYQI